MQVTCPNCIKHRKGDLIQIAALIMVCAGLAVEFIMKANIYWIITTSGAVLFAIGTKIKGR